MGGDLGTFCFALLHIPFLSYVFIFAFLEH